MSLRISILLLSLSLIVNSNSSLHLVINLNMTNITVCALLVLVQSASLVMGIHIRTHLSVLYSSALGMRQKHFSSLHPCQNPETALVKVGEVLHDTSHFQLTRAASVIAFRNKDDPEVQSTIDRVVCRNMQTLFLETPLGEFPSPDEINLAMGFIEKEYIQGRKNILVYEVPDDSLSHYEATIIPTYDRSMYLLHLVAAAAKSSFPKIEDTWTETAQKFNLELSQRYPDSDPDSACQACDESMKLRHVQEWVRYGKEVMEEWHVKNKDSILFWNGEACTYCMDCHLKKSSDSMSNFKFGDFQIS